MVTIPISTRTRIFHMSNIRHDSIATRRITQRERPDDLSDRNLWWRSKHCPFQMQVRVEDEGCTHKCHDIDKWRLENLRQYNVARERCLFGLRIRVEVNHERKISERKRSDNQSDAVKSR